MMNLLETKRTMTLFGSLLSSQPMVFRLRLFYRTRIVVWWVFDTGEAEHAVVVSVHDHSLNAAARFALSAAAVAAAAADAHFVL